jgi:hypothetical protein
MTTGDWKSQLKEIFQKDTEIIEKKRRDEEQARLDKLDATWFATTIVIPVFEEIKNELSRYNRAVRVVVEDSSVELTVYYGKSYFEFSYKVSVVGRYPVIAVHCNLWDENPRIISKMSNSSITIDELSREALGAHFVQEYNRYKRYFREV